MRLHEILDTLQGLDRAFDEIAADYTAARGGLSAPSWWSIVRERPRRPAGHEQGALLCAKHGGAPHGLPHDPLSDHLASELRAWVHVARWSPAARSLLGIERIDPAAGARVGALVYLDEAREHRLRFAASESTLQPTDAGRWMWAKDRPERVGFRPRSQEDSPFLFFSNLDGKARRWSFSDVRKGFEEYLAAQGRRPDEAELARLWTSPTPMLLGTLTDYNRRNATERAPLALSEVFLEDGGPYEIAGELAEPCEACQFALSAWMCGRDDVLARMLGDAPSDYPAQAEAWAARIRDRREPPRKSRSLRGAEIARREPVRVRLDSTAFPVDHVEIRALSGREALSQPFSFDVEIVSLDGRGPDATAMLGAPVSLVFERGREEVRRVNGVIAEIDEPLGAEADWQSHRLRIVPRHGASDGIVSSDASTGFRPLPGGALPFRPQGERADVFELTARARALPTPHHSLVGRSDRADLAPGATLTLTGHPRVDGTDYLVTEVEHHALQTLKGPAPGAPDEGYRNTFELVPSSGPHRPPRASP